MRVTRRRFLTTTAAAAATLASPAIVRAQSTTVEFWTFIDPAARGVRSELLNEILRNFEAANPGTTVHANIIQWTEISPQLLRAARAGNTPDVVMLYSPFLATHVNAGTLTPLNDRIGAWSQARLDDTIQLPVARDKQGQIFALPWELRVYGQLYRADLIRQAGLQPPQTLDDTVDVALALRTPDRQGMAISFAPATSTTPIEWLLPHMLALGTKVLNDDGSASFGGPGAERMLGHVHDLVHKHKVLSQDTALMVADDVQNLGIAGQVAMMQNGTHRLSTVQERAVEGSDWSFIPFPPLEAGKPVLTSLQGWNLAVPKSAKNPEQAWKLIDYWTGPDVQLAQASRAGYLPTLRSVGRDPAFATEQNVRFGLPAVLDHIAANALDFAWPENADALNDTLGRMVQQVFTNRMSVAEAIAWGEDTYNELRQG